jgi:transcription termination factor Rho
MAMIFLRSSDYNYSVCQMIFTYRPQIQGLFGLQTGDTVKVVRPKEGEKFFLGTYRDYHHDPRGGNEIVSFEHLTSVFSFRKRQISRSKSTISTRII